MWRAGSRLPAAGLMGDVGIAGMGFGFEEAGSGGIDPR